MRTYGADSKPIQQYLASWSVAKLVSPSLPVLKINGNQKCADTMIHLHDSGSISAITGTDSVARVRNTICAQK